MTRKRVTKDVYKMATEFERSTLTMLKDMGFDFVDGGPKYKIGGHQIDAICGTEDVVIIFECFYSDKHSTQQIKDKIVNIRGKMPLILNHLKTSANFSGYDKYRFVFATNLKLTKEELIYANKDPRVYILDGGFIDFYKQLSKLDRDMARYNMLGELNVKPRVTYQVNAPAFRANILGITLYMFYTTPKKLIRYAYVARREVGKEYYYQRMIDRDRVSAISKYIIRKEGIFPNSIIISFVSNTEFIEFKEVKNSAPEWPEWLSFGILQFPFSYRSAWIVDGQHRLIGALKSDTDIALPITAFDSLELQQQAKYFLDINSKQKPVPSDLLWDLHGELRPDEREGLISRIAKRLDEEEPLRNKIYIPLKGPKGGKKIKLSGLCNALFRCKLIEERTLHSTDKNPYYKLLSRRGSVDTGRLVKKISKDLITYLNIIDRLFSDPDSIDIKEEFLFDNSGLSILIYLYERIIAMGQIPNTVWLERYLKPLKEYLINNYSTSQDLKELRRRCTSEIRRTTVTDEFVASINIVLTSIGIELPLSKKYEDDLKRVIKLEKKVRQLVNLVLSEKDKEWTKKLHGIKVDDKTLYDILKGRSKLGGELWSFLDLNECKKVITYDKFWPHFKPYLIDSKSGFSSRKEFETAIDWVRTKIRNPRVHGRPVKYKYGDIEIARSYFKKLNKCIQDALKYIKIKEIKE